ncbi:MAG TPA: winged helix-turn-helix transcriptional regulator [Candidatus Thermoplasmatota archaeon]|nr:winged helix-turn-helix transcriptional regulator [Candidatus Thermoplasmatota archaeon]
MLRPGRFLACELAYVVWLVQNPIRYFHAHVRPSDVPGYGLLSETRPEVHPPPLAPAQIDLVVPVEPPDVIVVVDERIESPDPAGVLNAAVVEPEILLEDDAATVLRGRLTADDADPSRAAILLSLMSPAASLMESIQTKAPAFPSGPGRMGETASQPGAVASFPEIGVPLQLAVVSATILAFVAFFYHRVRPNLALQQDLRARIHERLLREPGVVPTYLARELGVNRTTVTHHLRTLGRVGLAKPVPAGRSTVWVAAGKSAEVPQTVVSEASRAVLAAIAKRPGLTLIEYARLLGHSKTRVHYHLKALAAQRAITTRLDGGRKVYAVQIPGEHA